MDDGGDGVEERKVGLAGQLLDRPGQARRGEGAGGDDHARPVGRRQPVDLLAHHGDQRVGCELLRDGGREGVAVHGQGTAGRELVAVGSRHHQRAGAAHLLVQEPDGVGLLIVGTKGI